jgi:large subunit ribosomal protein L3
VPGAKKGWVLIRDAVKSSAPEGVPFPAGVKGGAAAAEENAEQAPEGAAPENAGEEAKNEE